MIGVLLVLVQMICLAYLALTGPVFARNEWVLAVEISGIFLAFWALYVMRLSKLNVFPQLRKGSVLITKGPYKIIRHPMYLSLVIIGAALLADYFTYDRLIAYSILIADLFFKVEFEERILIKDLSGYSGYRVKTFKLIPYLY